jgi:CheY-like chemotaxis protein
VNQLGGKISIRSQLGQGTDIEVNIPIEKVNSEEPKNTMAVMNESIMTLQEKAIGKSMSIFRSKADSSPYNDVAWTHIQRYCSEWFGFRIDDEAPDIIITDTFDKAHLHDGQRVLIVHEDIVCAGKHKATNNSPFAAVHICQPLGPFKLARSLLGLMDLDLKNSGQTTSPLDLSGYIQEQTLRGLYDDKTYNLDESTSILLPNIHQIDDADYLAPEIEGAVAKSVTPLTHDSTLVETNTNSSTHKHKETYNKYALPTSQEVLLSPPKAMESTPGSLHILAVDDNAVNLQLLYRYLSKRKTDTIVLARSGFEAIEAVRKLREGEIFDVIFMDISMPTMDGFEATRLIRLHEKSLLHRTSTSETILTSGSMPIVENCVLDSNTDIQTCRSYIVALTGLASRRDRNEADSSGFDDYLTKPTPFEKIGTLLTRLSEEKAAI